MSLRSGSDSQNRTHAAPPKFFALRIPYAPIPLMRRAAGRTAQSVTKRYEFSSAIRADEFALGPEPKGTFGWPLGHFPGNYSTN
jgi:hypothetical protein